MVNYSGMSTVSIRFINLGKNILIEIEDEGIGFMKNTLIDYLNVFTE